MITARREASAWQRSHRTIWLKRLFWVSPLLFLVLGTFRRSTGPSEAGAPMRTSLAWLPVPVCLASVATANLSSAATGDRCGPGEVVIYSFDSSRMLVLGTGELKQNNPLRPLASSPVVVWHVLVNGVEGALTRLPSGRMHEGSSVAELEYLNEGKVRWQRQGGGFPNTVPVESAKRVAIGPFVFSGCEVRTKTAFSGDTGPRLRRGERVVAPGERNRTTLQGGVPQRAAD